MSVTTAAAQPFDSIRATFEDADFRALAAFAHREIGLNLTESKKPLIQSRLAPRLKARRISRFRDYLALLGDPSETEERRALISALTTNVTSFFREVHLFDILRDACLPAAIARARKGERLRLWSAGCSTGQEAYCMAMTLLAAWPDAGRHDARILATDIDPVVVEKARTGQYDLKDLESVSDDIRNRFFEAPNPGTATASVGPDVRALISFAELNLMTDWPFKGPFDAIFCRNVAIYFDADTQARLWDRLCRLVAPGGYLFIGHSERLTGSAATVMQPAGTTCFHKPERQGVQQEQ